jgi:16S rRNA (guanine1207-N2)-methyltransferase
MRQILGSFLPLPVPSALLLRDERGGLGSLLRERWPDCLVVEHHLDAWTAREHERWGRRVVLAPDPPADLVAAVIVGVPRGSEAIVTREALEAGHDRLEMDGRLLAVVAGGAQRVREMMREIFGKADVQVAGKRGAVVSARRRRAEPRSQTRTHVLRVPRGPGVLEIASRPGTFCFGRLDAGTKALLGAFRAAEGSAVLDLGAGTGILGLAAARDGATRVVLVDANARACALARENAARNHLQGVDVLLRADLEDLPPGPFDLVLANPPYFSDGRIARRFSAEAARALAPGGTCIFVARAVPLHRAILREDFEEVEVEDVRGYGILRARRPRQARPLSAMRA